MRTAPRVLAALLLASALGGCGSDDDGDSGGDDAATGASSSAPTSVPEVLDVGRPVALAEDGEGRLLVAHLVEEGPRESVAAAWRLEDADGETIAEGPGRQVRNESSIPGIWPLADGFLVDLGGNGRYERLDGEGELTPVEEVDTPRPLAAGDVAVEGARGVYSPQDETIAPTPRLPGGAVAVELVLDPEGGAWALPEASDAGTTMLHLPVGRTTWEESALELPGGGYPVGLEVTEDLVVVPVARSRGAGDRLDALLVRARTGEEAAWRRLPAPSDLGSSWFSASVAGLPDGRLLVFDDVDVARVVDPVAETWEVLALPEGQGGRDHGWVLEVAGDRLYALDWVDGAAYASTGSLDDLGSDPSASADSGSGWREVSG
ncbi:hypothetical protein [Nocardioides sp. zg-DK7169]|uniref:hypothetical protein n=1 Tax=Nocardioides sp. zg-DK7169 TaxID=2736600 RepID=UPI00155749A2|nr:hypothetical protein [Nocardioides sp. zg-DK7169]NPC96960.1 hypothetical protein [Nocardioides sp. zg-DK7169]